VHFCKLRIVFKVADIVFLLFPMLTPLSREKGELPWYLRHSKKYEPLQSARSCTCPTCPRVTAGREPKAAQSRVEGDHTPDCATSRMKRFRGKDEGLTESLRVDELVADVDCTQDIQGNRWE
jgi:hypothetical protein